MTGHTVPPHGGNLYAAMRQRGDSSQELLDFSANINPLGLSESIRQSLLASLETIIHYPDAQSYALTQELSHYYQVDPKGITIGNGAVELMYILCHMLKPKGILVTAPTFSEYEAAGKASGAKIEYFSLRETENFTIEIDKLAKQLAHIDIVFLCNPNNPTGTTLTKEELKKWVNYALANDTLILFDAAYEAYIQDPEIPHSIYEIKGAKKCAIEFRSFSKTAGFTGVRCGYTIVPKEVTAATLSGERISLNKLWNRRQCTKFNGTSYITQRGAEAIYSPEGKEQVKETINYYMTNAKIMKEGLEATGLKVYGGENAPYLWVKTPNNTSSWRFFDQMLYEANVVGTPGVGFGPSGEGYIRLTAFGERENCIEAMRRIRNWIK